MSEWIAALAGEDSAAQDAVLSWIPADGSPVSFSDVLPFRALHERPAPAGDPTPVAPAAESPGRTYADGEAAGRAAALAEFERELASQRALRLAFRQLDEAAVDMLATDLADTVMALCEEVLSTFAADRTSLLVRCRAAAERLGGAAAALRLHLHPCDIEALGPEALAGWAVIADSALEPGGLLLEGPDGAVRDTPADWRRAIAAAVRP